MTRYNLLLAAVLISALSCQDENQSPKDKIGKIQFTFASENSATGGRVKENISSLLVSVKDQYGNFVFERKNIRLYKFGEEYLSEPVPLTRGNFQLTEFIVLDGNSNAQYATPLEGSPLDYLVSDPLPVNIFITADSVTKVIPEVIRIEGHAAADFGYATFGLGIVDTFTFSAGVLIYNPVSQNFELTDSHMKVIGRPDSTTLFDENLGDSTNRIRVKDRFENYTIYVTKDSYTPYEKTFTREQLAAYDGDPLVITLLAQSLADGLIAFYPFNGNADDESGNEFNGIVHDAQLTTDRHGQSNSAYIFDGLNDYIQVPHNKALNLDTAFTISLWAEISSSQEPEAGINDILRKWTGNAEGYPFSISYLNPLAADEDEDKILFARYDGQICGDRLETHSPTVNNDTFLHIALVKNGDKITTFLNNHFVAEVTDPTTCSTDNTSDMTIGCRGNLVRFFKGKIDDIRIYNRPLTETEVGQLAKQ